MTLTLYARLVLMLAFLIITGISLLAAKKHPTLFFSHWIRSFACGAFFVGLHLLPSFGTSLPLTVLSLLSLTGAASTALLGIDSFLLATKIPRRHPTLPLYIRAGFVLLLGLILLGARMPYPVVIAPSAFFLAIALAHFGFLFLAYSPARTQPNGALLLGVSLLMLGGSLVAYPFYHPLFDWIACLISSTFLILGGVGMTLLILEDHEENLLTTNRELALSEEKYAKVFRSCPDAVCISRGCDGVFLEVNDAFYTLTDQPPGGVVGHSSLEIGLLQDSFRALMVKKITAEGRIENLEMHFFKRKGERRDGLFSAESIAIEGEACLLAVVKDITNIKQAEREHLQAQQERIEALREADRLKDEFVSIISHELRTPLNGIMGFASLLDDGVAGELHSKQADFVQRILASSEHMLSLVNDLLDFAQMQAGQFEINPAETDVPSLIQEALTTFEPLSSDRGIRLTSRIQASSFYLDRERIFQVLSNLLSNALKFTTEGQIHIDARLEGDRLVIEVSDTGIGIPPEDLPTLFQPFHQLDMGLTRRVGGVGLGLSISKNIVEAHGGSLTATSPGTDQGSTFRLEL